MLNEKLAALIARYLSGEASPHEKQELFELLKDNPQQQYVFEILTSFWTTDRSSPANDSDDDHFNHILALANDEDAVDKVLTLQPPPSISRRRRLYAWSTAAAAVLVTALVCLYNYFPQNSLRPPTAQIAPHSNEVKAKSGARSRLTLPDGTKVWLNADTRIMYGRGFNARWREVELEGEAFFDVAKDANRPFIVHAAGIDVKVLGTAFNVKSYPQEPTTETTLMRGSVEVVKTDEPGGARIILQPHEKLVFTKSIDSLRLVPAGRSAPQEMLVTNVAANLPDSAIQETSWIYNRLSFDGDTFRELAVKMERWFNVHIRFRNSTIADYRFKGVFKNETIGQALRALQVTADFQFRIDGDNIEIFESGSK